MKSGAIVGVRACKVYSDEWQDRRTVWQRCTVGGVNSKRDWLNERGSELINARRVPAADKKGTIAAKTYD